MTMWKRMASMRTLCRLSNPQRIAHGARRRPFTTNNNKQTDSSYHPSSSSSSSSAIASDSSSTLVPPGATHPVLGANVGVDATTQTMRQLYRRQRVWLWIGGTVCIGVTLVAFGPELKLGMSKHTAEVASKSLQDETLQNNTRELASQIVQTVLNDPKVLDQATQFLQRLVVMEATRDALRSLIIHTLNDPMTLQHVSNLVKHTTVLLLEDPKTLRQLVNLLRNMAVDPQAKASLLLLLEELMKDERTRTNLAQLFAHTFTQDPVKQAVTKTLGDSVHQVLSQPDIQNHAKEFIGNVVHDRTVQAQSGDAIWGTIMYAITPGWLSWIWQQPEEVRESVDVTIAEQVAKESVAAAVQSESNKSAQLNQSVDADKATDGIKRAPTKRMPSRKNTTDSSR